jgi:CBS domain-containing protein
VKRGSKLAGIFTERDLMKRVVARVATRRRRASVR